MSSDLDIPMTLPPRERILAAARALFHAVGLRGVGVEAIAEAASTNKMTLYRHFESKDVLIAEVLREEARAADAGWQALGGQHAGDPRGRVMAWIKAMATFADDGRGCPFANAAAELPDPEHPARRVIEEHKRHQRDELAAALALAGAGDPLCLADELVLLVDGAHVSHQSLGPGGPSCRLAALAESLLTAAGLPPPPPP